MNKIKTNKKVKIINTKLVIAFWIMVLILVIPVTVLAEDAADTAASTAESTQANDSSGVGSSSSQTGSTDSTESSVPNDSTAGNNSEPTPVNDPESSNDSAPPTVVEAPASESSDENPESQTSDDNPAEPQTTDQPEVTPQNDNLNDSEQAEPADSNDAVSGLDGDEGETGDSGNSNSVDDTPVSEDPTTPQSTPDEESAPAEKTTVGNSYTAEVTSERVVGTGKEDTSFTVSFMEVGEHTPLGSVQLTLPDGFSDLSLVEGSLQASDGKSWTGGVVGLVLSLWAQNADSYLGQGESVDATFTATTPTEAGIYTFGTEAWTDASSDFDDVGTTKNNMAAGYSDPTVGVFEINSPVQISTVEQLEHLSGLTNADDLAKDYEQTANIDFSTKYNKDGSGQWPEWNDGKGWDPIGTNSNPFTGTYDGQEFTISNLFINRPDENDQGLFGVIGSVPVQAVLKNIGLENVDITGNRNVGGLVGWNNSSTITNSYATGDVTGNSSYIGGLVGDNNHGTITDSYAKVNVTGDDDPDSVGGLAGANNYGTITDSYATGTVQSINYFVGGLVGYNNSTISKSYATGDVSGNEEVGGLAGFSSGTIKDSYADGNVTGTGNMIGGLVGELNGSSTSAPGMIENSHATGIINGVKSVGGLVGYNYQGTINSSYAEGKVTGNVNNTIIDQVGGLVGNNGGTINRSSASGDVEGVSEVGGLAGFSSGTIKDSYADGNVTGNRSDVGGLVGRNNGGTIDSSYATGVILGHDDNVGGLVGHNKDGKVKSSYATGNVTGTGDYNVHSGNYIGGLVGYNDNNSTIENSYATGNVEGIAFVGGLVGSNNATITNSFWDIQTSGQATSDGGTGLPTADMKKLSTFIVAGWDIAGQDGSYPVLGWQVNWSDNTWYMGTPPTPDNTNGGSFGGDFGFFDFEFPPGLALLSQNGSGLTTITGQGNAPITPGIIASGSWNDLNQAVAAYQAALVSLENSMTTLSPAELALQEVELAIARAAILALEAKLLAADGLPYNLSALQAAYAAAVATVTANQSALSAGQMAAANQLLTAIAGVIAALQQMNA